MRSPLSLFLRRLGPLLALAALVLGAAEPARAQDPFGDFLQGIFGGGQAPRQARRPPAESPRMRRLVPHREYGAPAYWRGQTRSAKKVKPQAPTDPNAPVFQVAVFGDTLAQQLADGLDEAYAERPEVRILHRGKESSGLVRDDFFDWPKAVREIVAGGEKIDLAVVMIGSNDRQTLHEDGQNYEPLSPPWRQRYAARIDAIRAAFREKNIPLVWVGLPVTKNEHFSADMAKLNEIYRDRATLDRAPFIDIWEAFADERNQYQAFGPDINGRIVKLRAGDGVHFTDVGARKVAHFVEGEVKRAMEAAHQPAAPQPAPEAAAPPAGEAALPMEEGPPMAAEPVPQIVAPGAPVPVAAPTLPERPAIGPVQPLTAAAAADGDLARRSRRPASPAADPHGSAARALVDHIYVEGGDQPTHPGRADDFSWPKGGAKATEPN
ncbi:MULTISPECIES: SGNH/GDSL hydrolase family protein [Methylosinus]|uniref:DUF459 domain-containing protein n=1 Tax=Methylosinus trichosporium (strain ATCC 35070 / NCIMB 11131 / UNIQEM 75 / OB3b) TaxID=595536 RepID=A0A2D2CW93_METT3|nr:MULTISPECIES: SGNH family hydrolase [Methylosinus]ATQ66929.1 DUF459 domain-containing protein [Methylosinus trichosporium OB3b]OBS54106.1 hypothetical protein A8B73_02380 [Methylosinus sp. 3S-1]